MNHHHRDLRRVARSAECRLIGAPSTPPEVIDALVRKARAAGVVVFLPRDLERMPWSSRATVESLHAEIYPNPER